MGAKKGGEQRSPSAAHVDDVRHASKVDFRCQRRGNRLADAGHCFNSFSTTWTCARWPSTERGRDSAGSQADTGGGASSTVRSGR